MTLPETRHSLFIRLQDAADDDAWREFTRIYEPAVYRFGRKKGLQHADAAELAQDVLTRVIQVVPKWDQSRSRGSFRSWLFTVARTRVVDAWRAASRNATRHGQPTPPDALAELSERRGESELDSELRRQVIRVAAERIRPEFQTSTWEAFWRTSIEGGPIVEVAADLKMSLGAVYAARSRVLSRLRDCVQRLWAECEQEVPS
jgi:RNA polymerase sigma-70 factor (ECF subfamily)